MNFNNLRRQPKHIARDDFSKHYYILEYKKIYSYNYFSQRWSIPEDSTQQALFEIFDVTSLKIIYKSA
jgi:hypothetical protein